MAAILSTGATFGKKISSLVARIVSFDTIGLHLLASHILQPYPTKCIDLDISHNISH